MHIYFLWAFSNVKSTYFISFPLQLLVECLYVLGTMIDHGDNVVSKIEENHCHCEVYILVDYDNDKKNKQKSPNKMV